MNKVYIVYSVGSGYEDTAILVSVHSSEESAQIAAEKLEKIIDPFQRQFYWEEEPVQD